MSTIGPRLARFLVRDDGPTAVEYAVMLALILVAVMTAITAVGDTSADWWQSNSDQISTAVEAAQV